LLSGSLSTPSAKGAFVSFAPASFESIATVVVGAGGQNTIQFNSIPSTFTHLQLRYASRDSRAGSTDAPVDLTFNGNTSAIYSKSYIQADGTTSAAGSEVNQTYLRLEGSGNGGLGSTFSIGITDIIDYTSSTKTKSVMQIVGVEKNASGGFVRFQTGQWYNTSPITSITLTPFSAPFLQYSHFALYGIKGS
jgi:hypothetical protein